MKKIILTCIFSLLTSISFAKTNNTLNIEALENINTSLERIENAITFLTSQNEKTAYNQKQTKSETTTIFKDIKLQIDEIKEEQAKIIHEINIHKIEIENIKNIIFMIKDTNKNNKNNENNNEDEKEKEATKEPALIVNEINTDLLITEDKEKDENNLPKEKQDDTESFNKALENFNKKDFTKSAINFADNIKNFPDGKNFHNNLLHLGLSMKELGNKNNACTAFAKIINSNEKIEKEIKDKAQTNFNELTCNPGNK